MYLYVYAIVIATENKWLIINTVVLLKSYIYISFSCQLFRGERYCDFTLGQVNFLPTQAVQGLPVHYVNIELAV